MGMCSSSAFSLSIAVGVSTIFDSCSGASGESFFGTSTAILPTRHKEFQHHPAMVAFIILGCLCKTCLSSDILRFRLLPIPETDGLL